MSGLRESPREEYTVVRHGTWAERPVGFPYELLWATDKKVLFISVPPKSHYIIGGPGMIDAWFPCFDKDPPPSHYYGTNEDGTKCWHPLPLNDILSSWIRFGPSDLRHDTDEDGKPIWVKSLTNNGVALKKNKNFYAVSSNLQIDAGVVSSSRNDAATLRWTLAAEIWHRERKVAEFEEDCLVLTWTAKQLQYPVLSEVTAVVWIGVLVDDSLLGGSTNSDESPVTMDLEVRARVRKLDVHRLTVRGNIIKFV